MRKDLIAITALRTVSYTHLDVYKRQAITNIMRLLKLDERVQNMVIENLISSGHGRTLLSIDDGDVQYQLADKILDENLSVREAEKLVKTVMNQKENKKVDEEESLQEKSMITFFENKICLLYTSYQYFRIRTFVLKLSNKNSDRKVLIRKF